MRKQIDVSLSEYDPISLLSKTEGMVYLAENLTSLDRATEVAIAKLRDLFGKDFIVKWESEWIDDFEYSHSCYHYEQGITVTIHEVDIDLVKRFARIPVITE